MITAAREVQVWSRVSGDLREFCALDSATNIKRLPRLSPYHGYPPPPRVLLVARLPHEETLTGLTFCFASFKLSARASREGHRR